MKIQQQFPKQPATREFHARQAETELVANNSISPAQSPSEFAAALVRCLQELNGRLENVRYRLFGDETDPQAPADKSECVPPIAPTLEKAHWLASSAIEQLNSIQSRL